MPERTHTTDVSKAKNASFKVMNDLQGLDIPDTSFDFVNVRFISGFMSKNGWPEFLRECFRVTRPGGVIRLLNQNAATYFKLSQPFLMKMGLITEKEVELLYKQALDEMMSPDFCAIYYLLSAWGQKPQ
jgi:ubiquinone/menaquinone biosynthesis C-methylase UbiE